MNPSGINGHVNYNSADVVQDSEMDANGKLSPEAPVVVVDVQSLDIMEIHEKRKRCQCSCISADCREWGQCCVDFGDEIRDRYSRCDCKGSMKKCFSVKKLKQRLPIIEWLPKYRLPEFQGDLIAGLTVGLTVIPQGLAYAQVAELPAQYGLYSAFMGCFIYCFLGTSKDITLGPTAIMSLMTAEFGASWFHGDATVAVVLTLFCGIAQLLMGALNIGFLVEFISEPVINAFTTAASITIAFGQIKKWLGLSKIPRDFLPQVYWTFKKLPETNPWDFLLGLCCMLLLYGMKRMKDIKYNDNGQTVPLGIRIGRKIIWLISTARNAIIVLVAAGLAAILLYYGIDKLGLTDEIDPGLPPFQVPKFTTTDGNTTYYADDIFAKIGSGFIIIPVIGLIETIAIGKAFARKNKYLIEANQELLAIGAANIIGSFVMSYPVTGSFSRTAVNSQSGVKTPAGGIWTGALVLLALGVLTPLFKYIPDAALAGVIIMAVLDMADFSLLLKLWKTKRLDLLPWITTFILSFILGIEYGILCGIGVSVLFLLFPWARPGLNVRRQDYGSMPSLHEDEDVQQRKVVVMELNSGLRFPGIEYVKERVLKEALRDVIPKPVVLDCYHLSALDFSSAHGLATLFDDVKAYKASLYIVNMQPNVLKTFESLKAPMIKYAATVDEAIEQIYENELAVEDNPRTTLLSNNRDYSSINPINEEAGTSQSRGSTASIPSLHSKKSSPHDDDDDDVEEVVCIQKEQ